MIQVWVYIECLIDVQALATVEDAQRVVVGLVRQQTQPTSAKLAAATIPLPPLQHPVQAK